MAQEKLVRVSTYARQIKKTRQTVYNWIKSGKLTAKEFDGVMFVVI